MSNFHKNVDCPASQDLLAFQNGEIPTAEQRVSIQKHLFDCEFCAAEAELYARCPQADEDCPIVEIPHALYKPAEALLENRQVDFLLLNRLFDESESVKI